MRKKLLATVLVASMVLSVAPVLPTANTTVAAAEDATESLVGNGWWNAANTNSKHINLAGDGSAVLYVGCTKALNGYSTFCVELNNSDTNYITTTSRADIWGVGSTADVAFEGKEADTVAAEEGHLYKITVTRTGNDFVIEYYDVTSDTVFHTFKAPDAAMGDDVDIYVIPQEGDLLVGTTEFEMPEVSDDSTGSDDSTDSDDSTGSDDSTETTTTDGTNFDAIETQPVVSYTFDSEDEIELAGEANIADGVLNLATSGDSFNKTYAKLPDLTSYDFSNGVTLTADISVAAYATDVSTWDWTPIFMIGDGTLGNKGEDATALYHFSQGFSSVGGVQGNFFEGYVGSAISSPYTWDYFSNEANRNQWYTTTVTITKDAMITYINGVKVQEGSGDYTNVLQAFKVAKNNYLGASYWAADADFAGSLDNVGIYNTALSADDVAALIGGTETPSTPSTPATPSVTKKTMKLSKVSVKKNATKITGTVSVKKATVKIKVGKKAYKKATVKAKNFTLKVAKLKKGTTVKIKVTKSGYKTLTKSYKVK